MKRNQAMRKIAGAAALLHYRQIVRIAGQWRRQFKVRGWRGAAGIIIRNVPEPLRLKAAQLLDLLRGQRRFHLRKVFGKHDGQFRFGFGRLLGVLAHESFIELTAGDLV